MHLGFVVFGLRLAGRSLDSGRPGRPDGVSDRGRLASSTSCSVARSAFRGVASRDRPREKPLTRRPPSSTRPLEQLAVLYSELATSDPVRRLMCHDGPLRGKVIATPVVGGGEFEIQLQVIEDVVRGRDIAGACGEARAAERERSHRLRSATSSV